MSDLIKNVITITLFMIFIILANSFASFAEIKTIEIQPISYEFNKRDYNFNEKTKVDKMTYGKKALGTFQITGDMSTDSTYMAGLSNFGIESGIVKFSYSYNRLLLVDDVNTWHLLSDDKKKVIYTNGEEKIKEKIKKGVVIIKTSYDKEKWETAVNPLINFYEDNPAGRDNLYTTSGEQLNKGCYYRIMFLYETGKGESSFAFAKWPTETKRHAEVYEFYLCNNNGAISIHNLTANIASISEAEYSLEVLKVGETLMNGSTTYGGFKIDKLGATSYKVFVNGNEVEDGAEFSTNGKYEIMTKTQLGKEVTNIVYVYKDNENGLNTYFDKSFVDGKRVFREGDIPTYDKNTKLKLKAINNDTPYIRGIVKDLNTDEILYEIDNVDRKEWIKELKEGSYQADLYNGLLESGSMYHYIYKFNIINEEAKPYVNQNNLLKREEMRDFNTKHYEVAYQTTRGGYIYVCFPTEEDAFNYAYEIEKRFIETKNDGIYYRDKENSNTKVKQNIENDIDKITLTKKVNEYARKNIEVAYFNPLESITYDTITNEEDLLKELETLSLSESKRIFSSQEMKEKLFSKKPYANNFELVNIADYDVVSAKAIKRGTQESLDLQFNKKLNNQLEGQIEYEIVEKNKYGDENKYKIVYVNENTTIAKWNFINNGNNNFEEISKNSNGNIYNVDYAILSEQENPFDDCALINISCKDAYGKELTCQLSEIKNLCLYKKGNYKITYIDRNANNFTININVKGIDKSSIENNNMLNSISDIYNNIYINTKMEE